MVESEFANGIIKQGRTGTRLGALLAVAVLVLTACQPHPTPTPTSSSTDASTRPEAAPTISPIPLPTPTSTLTPSPTPVGMVGPYWYPEDVNPLTGLVISDPATLDRRPLAIKVSNEVPEVRPQAGLSYADLVYEHYAEGGATRFTAIFYSRGARQVGSVRSGRLIDLELVLMYDAIFAASGYSDGVAARMRAQPWFERNISITFGYGEPFLFRAEGAAPPHNLFVDPGAIWTLADERGFNQSPDLTPGMAFFESLPTSGDPATRITIQYRGTTAFWRYYSTDGLYRRWQDGEQHTDSLTGEQITAANVVVIGAVHVDTDIPEDAVYGTPSVEIQIWGEGPLTLFRDGQRFQGFWHREDREEGFTFTDLEGDVLPLRPGSTWFQVVPLEFDGLIVES